MTALRDVSRTFFRVLGIVAGTCVLSAFTPSGAVAAEPAPLNTASAFSVSASKVSAKVGSAATVVVTVTATNGFKPNTEYPHKVKNLATTGSVALPGGNVKGSVSGGKIVFSIPVTPKAAGRHTVNGNARFSVCNATECVVETAPIRATVTGK